MQGRILAAAIAATAAFTSTAVAAVPGTAPLRVRGATATGVYRARSMNVTIALAPRPGLSQLIARQRAGSAGPISSAAFNARYAPSTKTVAAVRRFARTNSLRVTSVSANRELVNLRGSSAAVASAFRTSFSSFRLPNGSTYFANTRAARLPASLRSKVASVLGLSSLGKVSLPLHRPSAAGANQVTQLLSTHLGAASGVNFPADYGPQDLWALYDAPSAQTGAGQTVAVLTEGALGQVQTDLRTFENQFGLPQVPWTTRTVGGGSNDTAGQDEWDLDTQYSTGFAPNVSGLTVYDGVSLANTDIANLISAWVTDDSTRQASFSAGECELLAQVTGFQTAVDNSLAQAAAQGQTLFTASGDTGSFCAAVIGVNGVPAGLPGVDYPAASPNAIGVGGTTVLGPGPNEIAWYAGGGGSTYFEPVPSYQSGAGGSFLGIKRGVPDVALDADPNSGYRVIVSGQEQIIGGTSASAPSWQGIWARAQGAHGGSLGFAGPVIYKTVPAGAFHDITLGAIGYYLATPGWDYTTGRGTPDISAFVGGA